MPRGRIMIVEDESLVAEDLSTCLSRSGYEVVGVADTCASATALADEARPDLALLDIRLKGEGDGIQLAGELRRRDIGYVYLTSHSDDGTLARAEVTEPLGYVLKPFSTAELVPVLRTALYRHAAELRTRNLAQWLRTTLNSIGDAVFVTDEQARLDYANPAAERLIRRPWRDLAGLALADVLRIVAPGTDVVEPCVAQRAMRNGSTVFLADGCDLLLEDGTRVPVDDCASPIRDRGGRVIGVVVVMRDASERRHAERQRREAERRLLDAERLQSLAALASGLAHDLNNMLTSILGHTAMCRAHVGPPGAAAVEQIESSARTAAQLCRRMLDGAGATPVELGAVDPAPLVTDAVARERVLAPASVRFVVAAPAAAVAVFADELQLTQVVQNLLRNAAEAMCGRTGTIRIGWSAVTLPRDGATGRNAADLPPGGYARIEVADDGPGVPADVQSRIFEPLFTTKISGRGLGLASAQGIVRRHAGALDVHSPPGQGACFVVHWPLAPARPAAVAAPRGLVLLVDDDDGVREVASRILRQRGWDCREAASGKAALDLLAAGLSADVVLLDVMMPGMDGAAVLQVIRRSWPELPVLLTSGAATASEFPPGDRFTAFLPKPFSVDVLLAELARWVPRH